MESKYKSADELKSFYSKVMMKKIHRKEQVFKRYLKESSAELENTESELRKLTTYSSVSKFNEIISFIHDKKKEFDDLYDDFNKPINVYVIGDNGLGKSTLTNALIGNEVANKNYESDVAIIYKYKSNKESENNVEIISLNGSSVKLEVNEAVEYLKNAKNKMDETKELIRRNYEVMRGEYQNDDNALNELQSEFDKELLDLSSNIKEIIWPIEENEILEKFIIADTEEISETSVNTYYKSDGVLYMIAADKMYLQQDQSVLSYITNRKAIGILNHIDKVRNAVGDIGVEKLLKEAKKIYKNKLNSIVPISAKVAVEGIREADDELIESSGIVKLKYEMEKYFFKNAREIKINGKQQGISVLLAGLNKNVKEFISELKENDNKRAILRSDFKEALQTETSTVKVKVDWILSNYEMNINNNIGLKSKDLFDFGSDLGKMRDYVENEIFNIDEFLQDLSKLKENIMKILQKFCKSIHY